jgi:hypothetical protein
VEFAPHPEEEKARIRKKKRAKEEKGRTQKNVPGKSDPKGET